MRFIQQNFKVHWTFFAATIQVLSNETLHMSWSSFYINNDLIQYKLQDRNKMKITEKIGEDQ